MPPTLDQFTGCILGLALGDALGAVVEARPAAQARQYVDEVLRGGRAGEAGREGFGFGQVTDDTQLMRELLESILETGRFEPARFAARLQSLVARGELVGGGPASVATAHALQAGLDWSVAGMPAPYAGNGAAMRAGPLGLLYSEDEVELLRVSRDQARVTHRDPVAVAGAVAITAAVALVSARRPISAQAFLERIGGTVEPVDGGLAGAIRQMTAWVGLSMDDALDYLRGHPLGPGCDWPGDGIPAVVTPSICWSLYAFLQAPHSWWDAVCTAIRVGGDTDTLAAMTGAIAGAWHGGAALPEHLTARLTDRGRWNRADLLALAERCGRFRPASA